MENDMKTIPDLNWNEYKRYAKAWDMYIQGKFNTLTRQNDFKEAKQALNKKPMHKTLLRKPNI